MDSKTNLLNSFEKIISTYDLLNNNDYHDYYNKVFIVYEEEFSKWCLCQDDNFFTPAYFNCIYNNNLHKFFNELIQYFTKNKIADKDIVDKFFELRDIVLKSIQKIFELDKEAEKHGVFYLTFEQMVNTARYLEYHMICLSIQKEFFTINKKDIANYYISLSYIEYLSEPEGEFFKKISILAKKNEIEVNTNDFYIITDNSEKEYYNSLLNLYKTSKVCEG